MTFQQVKGNKGAIFIQDREEVDPETWEGVLLVVPRSQAGMLPAVEITDTSAPAPMNLINFWVGVEYPGDSVLVAVRKR